MMSLRMIDDDDDNTKCHRKSDDVLMTVWPLPLMTLPLDLDWYILKGQASLLSTRNIQQLRLKNKIKKFRTYSKLSNKK